MNVRGHLALLAFAWRVLGRRKGKTLALSGGLTMTVALVSGVLFATGALRGEAARATAIQPDLVVEQMAGGRPGLVDPSIFAFLARMPGVRRVRPRVWGYVFLPPIQANVTLVGREAGGEAPSAQLGTISGALASGRDFLPEERGVAVIGASLAKVLGVSNDDLIALPSPREDAPPLRIVGTFASQVALYTSDVVLADGRDARMIFDYPDDRATDLAIDLANPNEASVVARAIVEKVPSARVIDKRMLTRTYALTYGRRAGVILAAALPALLCMLVLALDRAAGLGPSERREIAVQKAVGWSTSDVLYAKLYESLLVGVAATACGIAMSYLWVFAAGAPGLRQILAGWSVLYPEVSLTPAVDPGELLGLCLSVLAPFVSLGIVPAWRAAILDPMEAMRS
jgi:ABC-type lipoprotein release transport system permease subunit